MPTPTEAKVTTTSFKNTDLIYPPNPARRDRICFEWESLTRQPYLAARNKEVQQKSRTDSFQALVKYSEQTDRCRHMVIGEFFGEDQVKACDRACDFCMDSDGLKKRKRDGLASEEWVSTQRERSDFYGEGYD